MWITTSSSHLRRAAQSSQESRHYQINTTDLIFYLSITPFGLWGDTITLFFIAWNTSHWKPSQIRVSYEHCIQCCSGVTWETLPGPYVWTFPSCEELVNWRANHNDLISDWHRVIKPYPVPICTHTSEMILLFYFYKYSGFAHIQSFHFYLKSELKQSVFLENQLLVFSLHLS